MSERRPRAPLERVVRRRRGDAHAANRRGSKPRARPPLARFVELGFPTRRHEEWKYTNPAPIAKVAWQPAQAATLSRGALDALDLPLAEGPHLVFVNGRLAPGLSSLDGLDPAVTLASHAQMLADDPSLRSNRTSSATEPFDDRAFAALARAFASDGAFVRIPRDHEATAPDLARLPLRAGRRTRSVPRAFHGGRRAVEPRDDLRSARDGRRRAPR